VRDHKNPSDGTAIFRLTGLDFRRPVLADPHLLLKNISPRLARTVKWRSHLD
jgi:hypothetical protein